MTEVLMGRPAGWMKDLTGRSPMRSPGAPSHRREEEIVLLKAQGAGVREIARAVGRDPSTISRELRRNAATAAANWTTGLRWRSPRQSGQHESPVILDYLL